MIHVIEVLEKTGLFDTLFITTLPGYENLYREIISKYNVRNVELVGGGKSRQESCFNALARVRSKRVLVHEAARPFVTAPFIQELVGYEDVAVVPVVPIDFTVSEGDDHMKGILERGRLKNVQLPQVFDTGW